VIERAVPHVGAEQLGEARAIIAEMDAEHEHDRWLALNARFHSILYQPSGAQTSLELIEQLRVRGERYVRLWSRGSGIHRRLEAGEEHVEIVALVEAGDAAGARVAVERHIAHTRERLIVRAAQMRGETTA
jgi:DNA-binding GntR family transcriptional regulator